MDNYLICQQGGDTLVVNNYRNLYIHRMRIHVNMPRFQATPLTILAVMTLQSSHAIACLVSHTHTRPELIFNYANFFLFATEELLNDAVFQDETSEDEISKRAIQSAKTTFRRLKSTFVGLVGNKGRSGWHRFRGRSGMGLFIRSVE